MARGFIYIKKIHEHQRSNRFTAPFNLNALCESQFWNSFRQVMMDKTLHTMKLTKRASFSEFCKKQPLKLKTSTDASNKSRRWPYFWQGKRVGLE